MPRRASCACVSSPLSATTIGIAGTDSADLSRLSWGTRGLGTAATRCSRFRLRSRHRLRTLARPSSAAPAGRAEARRRAFVKQHRRRRSQHRHLVRLAHPIAPLRFDLGEERADRRGSSSPAAASRPGASTSRRSDDSAPRVAPPRSGHGTGASFVLRSAAGSGHEQPGGARTSRRVRARAAGPGGELELRYPEVEIGDRPSTELPMSIRSPCEWSRYPSRNVTTSRSERGRGG